MIQDQEIADKAREFRNIYTDSSDHSAYGMEADPHFLLRKLAELELRIEALELEKQGGEWWEGRIPKALLTGLAHCKTCGEMTHHKQGVCMKCKS